jgi:hypothetical protein
MAGSEIHGELTRSVDELTEEVRVLRDAVDELREVPDHLCRQIPHDLWQVLRDRRLQSMSRDPSSPDFKTNNVPDEEIALARSETAGPALRPDEGCAYQRLFPELADKSGAEG